MVAPTKAPVSSMSEADMSVYSSYVTTTQQGETIRVYTDGDVLYVHNQSIALTGIDDSASNTYTYTFNSTVYAVEILFYGGSGGAEITNNGSATGGAETFSSDQVVYDSSPSDGNVTIFAGIVSQGTGEQVVTAPRIPSGVDVYEVPVSLSVTDMNAALDVFKLAYDAQTQVVTLASSPSLQQVSTLANAFFDTRKLSRNERQVLAENCVIALTEQIARDIPDEFTSGEEAMLRLGISVDTMATLIQEQSEMSPTHALAMNITNTPWEQDQTYATYGSSLLRNIVLSLCTLKPSRVQTGSVVFQAGDEIVFYVTFTGVIRVSGSAEPERFGLSQSEIEVGGDSVDQAAWVKYVCRLVR